MLWLGLILSISTLLFCIWCLICSWNLLSSYKGDRTRDHIIIPDRTKTCYNVIDTYHGRLNAKIKHEYAFIRFVTIALCFLIASIFYFIYLIIN